MRIGMERSMILSEERESGSNHRGFRADHLDSGGQVLSVANPAVAAVRPASNGRISTDSAPRRAQVGESLVDEYQGRKLSNSLYRWTRTCDISCRTSESARNIGAEGTGRGVAQSQHDDRKGEPVLLWKGESLSLVHGQGGG